MFSKSISSRLLIVAMDLAATNGVMEMTFAEFDPEVIRARAEEILRREREARDLRTLCDRIVIDELREWPLQGRPHGIPLPSAPSSLSPAAQRLSASVDAAPIDRGRSAVKDGLAHRTRVLMTG